MMGSSVRRLVGEVIIGLKKLYYETVIKDEAVRDMLFVTIKNLEYLMRRL
jgi:hypothetical protein